MNVAEPFGAMVFVVGAVIVGVPTLVSVPADAVPSVRLALPVF